MGETISLRFAETHITDCETCIVVPEIAMQEAGYIKTFTIKDSGHSKHVYHALAQMVYFQFQDQELELEQLDTPLTIDSGEESCQLDKGMVIYRTIDGSLRVLVHGSLNNKKLLEAAHRYCTRWVRLDI